MTTHALRKAPSHKTAVRNSGGSPSRGFQPDVEGLRAIAVMGVVAFHATVPFITGGYVGVDVFFVISGYLITGQLLREVGRSGKVDLLHFYGRRARRILPAASIVLVVVALVSALLEPTLGLYHAAQDLLAAALYTTNWHFIALGTDYLAQSTASSPVLHFWSLAVEEQFYLVWPLLILASAFVAKKFNKSGKASSPSIAVTLLIVTATSFVAGLVLTISDPKLAYMATQTRAWEFGVGGLLALASSWLSRREGTLWKLTGRLSGWVGLGAIMVGCLRFTEQSAFPGTAALLPTIGAAMVIGGGLVSGVGVATVGSILALRPVRYLGRLSYAWYLWHWPVLILVELKTGTLTWQYRVVLMVVALFLAAATLHLIEVPISRWKSLAMRVAPAYALGILCMALTVGASLGIGSNAVFALGASGSSVSAASIQQAFGKDKGKTSGDVVPTPLNASGDVPTPSTCLFDEAQSKVVSCELGPVKGLPVVLFGDSHAEQWLPAIKQMALTRGWRLTVYAKSGCPVPNYAPRQDDSRFSKPACIKWRSDAITAIAKLKPSMIIVSSLSFYIPDSGETLTAWNSSLDRLRKNGVPIAYIRDTPFPQKDVPTCVSSALDDWTKCAFTPKNLTEPVIQQSIIGNEKSVTVIDLYHYLCPGTVCPAVRNGVLLYRDDSHITATAAKALEPAMNDAFVAAKLIPDLKKK